MDIRADGENVKSISISKSSLPFYELPQRKTSAEIINEARVAILGEFVLFFSSNIPTKLNVFVKLCFSSSSSLNIKNILRFGNVSTSYSMLTVI